MVRMATRREKSEEIDDNALCPKIIKRIQALTLEARECKVFKCGGGELKLIMVNLLNTFHLLKELTFAINGN